MVPSSTSPEFPDLPLICLRTARDSTTHQLVEGKNIVIGKEMPEPEMRYVDFEFSPRELSARDNVLVLRTLS